VYWMELGYILNRSRLDMPLIISTLHSKYTSSPLLDISTLV
jgi:hypothetical protein